MAGERQTRKWRAVAARRAVAAILSLLATGCDAPTMPGEAPAYDPTALSGDVLFGWPLGRTVGVYVHAAPAPDPALVASVERALAAWEGATRYGELRLRRVTSAAEADVVVRAAAAPPLVDESVCGGGIGEGAGFALVCFADDTARTLPLLPSGAGRVKVSIVVNRDAGDTPFGSTLDGLVAHELGHALGIAGHSPEAGDVMHPAPVATRPSERDARTLRYILHQPKDVRL